MIYKKIMLIVAAIITIYSTCVAMQEPEQPNSQTTTGRLTVKTIEAVLYSVATKLGNDFFIESPEFSFWITLNYYGLSILCGELGAIIYKKICEYCARHSRRNAHGVKRGALIIENKENVPDDDIDYQRLFLRYILMTTPILGLYLSGKSLDDLVEKFVHLLGQEA